MAHSEHSHRFHSLWLDTAAPDAPAPSTHMQTLAPESKQDGLPQPPTVPASATAQPTIGASRPMNIPTLTDEPAPIEPDNSHPSYIEHYMRHRQPSISFDKNVITDSGHRQSMTEPLQKPAKIRVRGRSLLQAMSEDKARAARAHSESDQTQYDVVTGRHLPKYSTTPPREQARIGEGRFPLLQTTVDELARESRSESHSHATPPQVKPMTSESIMSPSNEVRTPRDDESAYLMSPIQSSPWAPGASSYEEPRSFNRTASQRWRDGQSAQDFFSRAGSMRKTRRDVQRSASNRDLPNSAISPSSAASSFLRAFSQSSSSRGEDNGGPPAVDAEGQTIGDDYVLGKQIGYGGFSVIKEVTQCSSETGNQRKLAVKIVRRALDGKTDMENEAAQAEFDHEVELWRFLDHAHILPLEAIYKMHEATFCFIPLNTGGTLFDLVRSNRKGLSTDLAKNYSFQIASALRYLHLDARVVHRDIKLENCLLETPHGEPGLVRLCDFGMAEWINDDNDTGDNHAPDPEAATFADRPPQKHIGPADTSTSAFMGGSLEYAAPEILRIADAAPALTTGSVERSIVSPAVDIWALGVCVYSLVVGSRPFSNSFQPRVVMAILAGDWDRDRLGSRAGAGATTGSDPDDVLDLVQGCLEMDEADRWDISAVIACRWLHGQRAELESDDTNKGGWRL